MAIQIKKKLRGDSNCLNKKLNIALERKGIPYEILKNGSMCINMRGRKINEIDKIIELIEGNEKKKD